jgi:hypothetical protein
MSLSVDGVVKLWDVAAEACLLTLKTDAFSAVLHPAGSHLVTGSRRGQVSSWALGTIGEAGGIKVRCGAACCMHLWAAVGCGGVCERGLCAERLPSLMQ